MSENRERQASGRRDGSEGVSITHEEIVRRTWPLRASKWAQMCFAERDEMRALLGPEWEDAWLHGETGPWRANEVAPMDVPLGVPR